MIFTSAGHNNGGIKIDPGAIGNGRREADLTVEFRNLVTAELSKKGAKFIVDNDTERLGEYLSRIKTGSGSVVLEFHFDASVNPKATGATVLIETDADANDRSFAKELLHATSSTLNIKSRGVLSESESHRGSLGLMKEDGILALLEICFISNINDLIAYDANKNILAEKIAAILLKYEALV